MSSMFSGCNNLTTIPTLNTSSVTNMDSMFYECYNLQEIPLLDTSSVTDMNRMFIGHYINKCIGTLNIPELDTSSVTDMYMMFCYRDNLSDESLNNILKMCINAINITEENRTLTYIGITKSQIIEKCKEQSNWEDFIAAGWTE